MELAVHFLGTAGAVPTPHRSSPAVLIQRGGERILFDCGEGTQRQLMRAGVGFNQIGLIFLTHLHADHYLGIPGMLKTWQLWGRLEPVKIYGPKGLRDLSEIIRKILGRFDFPVEWIELSLGSSIKGDGYSICPISTSHKIPSFGYSLVEVPRPGKFSLEKALELGVTPGPDFGRLQRGEAVMGTREVRPDEVMGEGRKGRKIVISGDTRPVPEVIEAARGAQLLIHEATFTSDALDRAKETGHSTAAEAAEVALQAEVDYLALIHLSFRHTARDLLNEARAIFPRTVLPSDLDRVVLPYPEKGEALFELRNG
ncbi:MAG TPA: ribonuclease Z [Cyanobacteria bacterium UBA8530]|nr:ribonuclease Z [Cyanobacteria bacterium UBA8530]